MPAFSDDVLYWYKVTLDKTIDGDTADMVIDFGFNLKQFNRFRLYGINAPEKKLATMGAGKAAQEFLTKLIKPASDAGMLRIRSLKDSDDKYGRFLAELWAPLDFGPKGNLQDTTFSPNGTWTSVNQVMIDSGHAVSYMALEAKEGCT